jgi:hypothetical protein
MSRISEGKPSHCDRSQPYRIPGKSQSQERECWAVRVRRVLARGVSGQAKLPPTIAKSGPKVKGTEAYSVRVSREFDNDYPSGTTEDLANLVEKLNASKSKKGSRQNGRDNGILMDGNADRAGRYLCNSNRNK